MKKSQIQTQLVLYIFVLVIANLILFFGSKMIIYMGDQIDRADQIKFQEDVKKQIIDLQQSFGKIEVKKFSLPSGYSEVCFFDINKEIETNALNKYPLVKDSIASKTKKNVFLIKDKDMKYSFYAENITFSDYPFYYCYKTEGGFVQIGFENRGDYISIIQNFRAESIAAPQSKLISIDSMAELELGAGVSITPSGITLSIQPVPNPKPKSFWAGGNVYEILPSGTTFTPNAIIRLKYDLKIVPIDADQLKIAYYDEVSQTWKYLPSEVNKEKHELTASITHITKYAVGMESDPELVDESIKEYYAKEAKKKEWIFPIVAAVVSIAITFIFVLVYLKRYRKKGQQTQ